MSYIAQYPATIPSTSEIYEKTNYTDWVTPDDFDGIRQELKAVMDTLGVNPQGEYTDVANRLEDSGSGGGFVRRSGIYSPDYSESDLADDVSSHNLDLSSIVPAGATAVFLSVKMRASSTNNSISFAEPGASLNYDDSRCYQSVADAFYSFDLIVPCSSDRVITYIRSSFSDWYFLQISIRGWF